MKYYTGIGSRKTPKSIKKLMWQMAIHLSKCGYILRSGGAQGADQAFEAGCNYVQGMKEIYLPWPKFENSQSLFIVKENGPAYKIAEQYHPYWHNLSQGAKKLQARNSHQVLGQDLKTLSDFVICYTKDGKGTGGTGQALRIAEAYDIPIFDCGNYKNLEELKEEYRSFLQNVKK
jgi:hypothetical protein